jgi:hypothetical protein
MHVQQLAGNKPSALLTIFRLPHILDETIGMLENLRCGCWALHQGELIQPLQRHFDVIFSQKLLSNLDYIVFSCVSYLQFRTYSMASV